MKFIFWLVLEALAIGLSTISLFASGFQLVFFTISHPAYSPTVLGLAVMGLIVGYQLVRWSVKGAVGSAWII